MARLQGLKNKTIYDYPTQNRKEQQRYIRNSESNSHLMKKSEEE